MKNGILTAVYMSLCPMPVHAQQQDSWAASKEVVERVSQAHPLLNFEESNVPSYSLPPLLTTKSGKSVNTPEIWKSTRRDEILELYYDHVYGRVPSTPYTKSFKVVHEQKNAMDGAATLRQVDLTIASEAKSLTIRLNIFLPNREKKPVPIFLLINNRPAENIDPTRKVKSEFWPAEEIIARGYAIAAFQNADVDPDNFDNFKNGIHGILDRGERQGDAWGTLSAWAWGASRCLDYLESDQDINSKKVALVGHSRGGKAALWAGAQDQRFAMVISNESGSGGAALARRRFGETIKVTHDLGVFYWFCTNYMKYRENENALPTDQHMLLSLIAPRPLYIACADEDLWGDPKGSYLSLFHALPVYRLLNGGSELPETLPPLDHPVIRGKVGFHIRSGRHNMLLQDWNWFMDFGDRVLK